MKTAESLALIDKLLATSPTLNAHTTNGAKLSRVILPTCVLVNRQKPPSGSRHEESADLEAARPRASGLACIQGCTGPCDEAKARVGKAEVDISQRYRDREHRGLFLRVRLTS